jgi:hypothetical protein
VGGAATPHGHQDKRLWEMDPPQIVMAGRAPATRAPAVVPHPPPFHRPGADGRDTPHVRQDKRLWELDLPQPVMAGLEPAIS